MNKRAIGQIAMLSAMIATSMRDNQMKDVPALMYRRNELLTNGGLPPIPARMLNQRQRRKLYRQTHTH